MVWWHELFNAVTDSVGICRLAAVFSSINAIGYLDICKLLEKAVGFEMTDRDLYALGERVYTTERLFINREGISRKDDYLPDLYFNQPIPGGPTKGEYIEKEKFEMLLDDYYQLHGWNPEGIPTMETVNRLNLDSFVNEGVQKCA
jgi:aldehyde:ferredoxin oxidoreductase